MQTSNGWNGTTVTVGSVVKVWAKGFGRGVRAVVVGMAENQAVVEITKTAKRCPFSAGNTVSIGAWWLEAV